MSRERSISIEDVAHAVGATYRGESCGTFGEFGCFSFFTNKIYLLERGGMFGNGKKRAREESKAI